jgi:hypothetical protein
MNPTQRDLLRNADCSTCDHTLICHGLQVSIHGCMVSGCECANNWVDILEPMIDAMVDAAFAAGQLDGLTDREPTVDSDEIPM